MEEKLKLWDFTKSIQKKTEYLGEHPDFEKTFSPFLTNRMFSNTAESIGFADIMNINGAYTPKMVYDFYYHAMPKYNGFIQFTKKDKLEDDVKLISQWFQVNQEKAIEYLDEISDTEMREIREYYKEIERNKKGMARK